MAKTKRLIVGISGASGIIYGVRVLQALLDSEVETHLVMSRSAEVTLAYEMGMKLAEVHGLADVVHPIQDIGASISSGSFVTMGMVIAPCSARTLAAIAHGLGDHLVHRAADVVLKERRKLVLAVREAPLHEIHLENMLKLSRMGAVICPPMPAFYTRPNTVDEIVTWAAARLLDQIGIHSEMTPRWDGEMEAGVEP